MFVLPVLEHGQLRVVWFGERAGHSVQAFISMATAAPASRRDMSCIRISLCRCRYGSGVDANRQNFAEKDEVGRVKTTGTACEEDALHCRP